MNTTRVAMDKKTMKITFLENENKQLLEQMHDMKETLNINKSIIKNLVSTKKSAAQAIEYTLN